MAAGVPGGHFPFGGPPFPISRRLPGAPASCAAARAAAKGRCSPACSACGLDLAAQDSGDGPAVFVILVLGALVVGLALAVELIFAPPLWLHMVLWPPVILVGAVALLRPFKATLIAFQYRHKVAGLGS